MGGKAGPGGGGGEGGNEGKGGSVLHNGRNLWERGQGQGVFASC